MLEVKTLESGEIGGIEWGQHKRNFWVIVTFYIMIHIVATGEFIYVKMWGAIHLYVHFTVYKMFIHDCTYIII